MIEEIISEEPATISQTMPLLRLSDNVSAREAVGQWLLGEIGPTAYPGNATFQPESFTWHVPVWLSYVEQARIGILADVYLHAATGIFLGRPSREDLSRRAGTLLQQTRR